MTTTPSAPDPAPLGDAELVLPPEVVHARAELLPEERAAGGSADPEAQAAAILAESEARLREPLAGPAAELDPHDPVYQSHEHRRSEDTV